MGAQGSTDGSKADAPAEAEAPATREIKPEQAAAPEKPAEKPAEEAAAPQEPAKEAAEKPAEEAAAPAPAAGESAPAEADAGDAEKEKEPAATGEEASGSKKERGRKSKAEKKAKAKAEPKAEAKEAGEAKAEAAGKGSDAKAKAAAKTKRQKTPPGVRVCVRNLQKDVTVEKLKALFAPYGNVLSAMVKTDGQGKSQGYGFINLPSQEEATKAINEMNGKMHEGKSLLVSPATERKDAKDAQAAPEAGKTEKGSKGKSKGTTPAAQASPMTPMAGGMSPTGMSWPMGYPYANPYAAAQYGHYGQYGMNPYAGMPYYNPYSFLPYPQQPGAMSMSANAVPFVPSGVTHDGGAAKEYKGTLKKVSERNGFGFILCDELKALYGRDVYVDSELLPSGVEAGSPLRFTFTLSDKKHPRAERVSLDTPSS